MARRSIPQALVKGQRSHSFPPAMKPSGGNSAAARGGEHLGGARLGGRVDGGIERDDELDHVIPKASVDVADDGVARLEIRWSRARRRAGRSPDSDARAWARRASPVDRSTCTPATGSPLRCPARPATPGCRTGASINRASGVAERNPLLNRRCSSPANFRLVVEAGAQRRQPKRPLDHAASQRSAPAINVLGIAFGAPLEVERLAPALPDFGSADRQRSALVEPREARSRRRRGPQKSSAYDLLVDVDVGRDQLGPGGRCRQRQARRVVSNGAPAQSRPILNSASSGTQKP